LDFSQCQVFPSHLRVVSFYSYTLKLSPFCIFVLVHKRIFFHLGRDSFVSCDIILDRLSLQLDEGALPLLSQRRLICRYLFESTLLIVHQFDSSFFPKATLAISVASLWVHPPYHGSLFQGLLVKIHTPEAYTFSYGLLSHSGFLRTYFLFEISPFRHFCFDPFYEQGMPR